MSTANGIVTTGSAAKAPVFSGGKSTKGDGSNGSGFDALMRAAKPADRVSVPPRVQGDHPGRTKDLAADADDMPTLPSVDADADASAGVQRVRINLSAGGPLRPVAAEIDAKAKPGNATRGVEETPNAPKGVAIYAPRDSAAQRRDAASRDCALAVQPADVPGADAMTAGAADSPGVILEAGRTDGAPAAMKPALAPTVIAKAIRAEAENSDQMDKRPGIHETRRPEGAPQHVADAPAIPIADREPDERIAPQTRRRDDARLDNRKVAALADAEQPSTRADKPDDATTVALLAPTPVLATPAPKPNQASLASDDTQKRSADAGLQGGAAATTGDEATKPTVRAAALVDNAKAETASGEAGPRAPAPPFPASAPALAAVTHVATAPSPVMVTAQSTFRTELTMAAANYAIFAGKAQTSQVRGQALEPPATALAEAAETRDQPIRVDVLPLRERPAPPVVIGNTLATAAIPTAGQGGQVNASAAAIAAGRRDPQITSPDSARTPRRAASVEPVAAARSAHVEPAMTQQTPLPASPAASAVVAAIGAEPTWRPSPVVATEHLTKAASAADAKTLSIQLHPAELGVVTATLRLAGGQLSVEISADTHEARSRLSSDSHAITKSLRALGFDIDQVTIMQPAVTNATTIRTEDAAPLAAPAARDQPSAGSGSSGGNGGRLGGQQGERNGDDTASASRNSGSPAADRGGGGLYI